jgi:hypothetical protein
MWGWIAFAVTATALVVLIAFLVWLAWQFTFGR